MAKCLWCANMCCGDANWCSERERIYSDSYLYREHECGHFRDCGISAVTLQDRVERKPKANPHEGERPLFELVVEV